MAVIAPGAAAPEFSLQREDGSALHYMLVNLKHWCKNEFEVIHQLRINTDSSHPIN